MISVKLSQTKTQCFGLWMTVLENSLFSFQHLILLPRVIYFVDQLHCFKSMRLFIHAIETSLRELIENRFYGFSSKRNRNKNTFAIFRESIIPYVSLYSLSYYRSSPFSTFFREYHFHVVEWYCEPSSFYTPHRAYGSIEVLSLLSFFSSNVP
jgi:hypothetical protein